MSEMTPSPQDDAAGAATSSTAASSSSASPMFTDAEALRLGGWHPAHAQVLTAASDDVVAAALVDTNSDGRHLDLGIYRRVGDAWVVAAEWIDVAREPQDPSGARIEAPVGLNLDADADADADDSDAASDDAGADAVGREAFTSCVANWGRARPGSHVAVDLAGEWATAMASPAGWWIAVQADVP